MNTDKFTWEKGDFKNVVIYDEDGNVIEDEDLSEE